MRRTTLADFESEAIDAEFVAGAEEARDRVTKFVLEKIVENAEIEGDVHLELSQLGAGSTMTLQSWLFSQGDDPSTVGDAIVDAAMEDGSASARGKTGYQLTIKGHRGRCAFSLEYAPRGDDDVNEAPNEKGLVAQSMRHTEKMMNMLVQVVDKSAKRDAEAMKEAHAEIRNLRGGQIETIQTLAALYDAKHARDIETKKIDKAESRKDEVAGFLMQGIPAVVNMIASKANGGRPIVQESSTPLEQMLHGFLSTFTQDQLQATVQTGQIQLKPEQMFGLLEIFKAVQEKAAAYEAARGTAPPPPQNGVSGGASHNVSPDPFPPPSPPSPV